MSQEEENINDSGDEGNVSETETVFRVYEGLSKARALFDFTAENKGELTFKQGDILTILDKDKESQWDGWWEGLLENGEVGFFPAEGWVEEIGEDEIGGSVPDRVILEEKGQNGDIKDDLAEGNDVVAKKNKESKSQKEKKSKKKNESDTKDTKKEKEEKKDKKDKKAQFKQEDLNEDDQKSPRVEGVKVRQRRHTLKEIVKIKVRRLYINRTPVRKAPKSNIDIGAPRDFKKVSGYEFDSVEKPENQLAKSYTGEKLKDTLTDIGKKKKKSGEKLEGTQKAEKKQKDGNEKDFKSPKTTSKKYKKENENPDLKKKGTIIKQNKKQATNVTEERKKTLKKKKNNNVREYIGTAVALLDYTPQSDAELPLKFGNIINITSKLSPDLWEGECNGITGKFCADYVKEKIELTQSAPAIHVHAEIKHEENEKDISSGAVQSEQSTSPRTEEMARGQKAKKPVVEGSPELPLNLSPREEEQRKKNKKKKKDISISMPFGFKKTGGYNKGSGQKPEQQIGYVYHREKLDDEKKEKKDIQPVVKPKDNATVSSTTNASASTGLSKSLKENKHKPLTDKELKHKSGTTIERHKRKGKTKEKKNRISSKYISVDDNNINNNNNNNNAKEKNAPLPSSDTTLKKKKKKEKGFIESTGKSKSKTNLRQDSTEKTQPPPNQNTDADHDPIAISHSETKLQEAEIQQVTSSKSSCELDDSFYEREIAIVAEAEATEEIPPNETNNTNDEAVVVVENNNISIDGDPLETNFTEPISTDVEQQEPNPPVIGIPTVNGNAKNPIADRISTGQESVPNASKPGITSVADISPVSTSTSTPKVASPPLLKKGSFSSTGFYPYAQLKLNNDFWVEKGLDRRNLESYLSPEEFETILGFKKEEWPTVAAWRKQKKKREAGLF